MPWDELSATDGILRQIAQRDSLQPHEVGIGDDSAVVSWKSNNMVVCSDVIVEEVHFSLRYFGYSDVGYKAISTNISDIAAMGAIPDCVLVTVAGPSYSDLDAIFLGLTTACSQYETRLIGGDLSIAAQLSISVCAIGHLVDPSSVLRRDGARAGQSIFVTGPLGRSSHSLRHLRSGGSPDLLSREDLQAHLRPQARIKEGQQALRSGVSSGIDISDGLALDLHRLADASGLGFRVESLPIAPGATEADALFGGDDYELILTTSHPKQLVDDFHAAGLLEPKFLGVTVDDRSLRTFHARPLPKIGYHHSPTTER